MFKAHSAGALWSRALRTVVACVLSSAALGAAAQASFPSGPVTLVVGFTPGGSNDVIARTLAPKLGEILGVPVVVENKPGASGAVGTAYTVNAKPDGHTITLGSTSVFSIGPIASPNLPYKLTDLQAVTTVAASASVIAVNPKVPAKSMPELVELAKKRPVTLASAGAGGVSHLNIESLRLETGGNFLHVAYKGAAPGITDVVGGQVDGIVMDYSALQGMLSQGRLRGIAASKPIDSIETSSMVISPWYGVMTSAKVPKSAVRTLHAAFAKALADPEVKAKLDKLAIAPFVLPTPEEADAYIRADSARWAEVVKTSGLKFE
jgi:tripartite-type tricarboxylate transporter receptor subunit TctC